MDSLRARVEVEIGGETFTLRGDTSEERIRRVASVVNKYLAEVETAQPRLGPVRTAVLAALRLADELEDLKEKFERVSAMMEQEWARRRELEGRLPAQDGS